MKKIITVLMIGLLGVCLAGCGNSGSKEDPGETPDTSSVPADDDLASSIDSDISAKNQNPDQDNYYSEIVLSDIFRGQTEHILGLFSQSVRDEIGEDSLTQMIADASATVQGSLDTFTVAEQAATGTRGGNGTNYNAYEILAYTDMDIYEIELLRCEGDLSQDDETYEKSLGLEYIRIMPAGTKYLPDGNIDTDLINMLDIGKGMVSFYADAARLTTYPEGTYTGYSVTVIQMNTETDLWIGANKEYAEELLASLAANGLQGDISDISGIYENNTEYVEELSQGYNYHIVAEDGTEFFAEFNPDAEAGQRVIKVK